MSEEIKKGPMTKEQFEYLCGLRHGVLLGAADFKEAVEAANKPGAKTYTMEEVFGRLRNKLDELKDSPNPKPSAQ